MLIIIKIKSILLIYSFFVFIKLFNLLVLLVIIMSMIMLYFIYKKNLILNIIFFIRFNIIVYNCVY